MDMSGEYRIAAPRETVWAALNDPEMLKQCIPGCEEIEKLSDTEFTAKVRAKVGPVSARFSGKVQLVDIDPPNGYRIVGEGTGGAAGFAKGGAKVDLSDDGAVTVLNYSADAQVGGKLAQIGSRLIQGTAKKYADDFFGNFSRLLEGGAVPAPAPVHPAISPPMPAVEAAAITTPAPVASVQPEEQSARPIEAPVFPPAQPAAEETPPPSTPDAIPPQDAAILSGAGPDIAAVPTAIDSPAGLSEADSEARAASDAAPPVPAPEAKGLNPVIWIGAIVIIIVLLLLWFR